MNDYNRDDLGLEPRDDRSDQDFNHYSRRENTRTNWEEYRQAYDQANRKPQKPKKGGAFKIVILALVFSLIGSLVGAGLGFNYAYKKFDSEKSLVAQPSYTINTNDNMNTVAAVAQANLESVVGITTKTILKNIFNQDYASEAMGSGFIVDQRGYVVTNNHVIESLSQGDMTFGGFFGQPQRPRENQYADQIAVLLNNGAQIPATVVWADKNLDLAVLKIETQEPLKPVELGDSDKLTIGEPAIAIGNPLSLEFHGTVTAGYISGKDRIITDQDGSSMSLIQTDASINPGNSGGPLFNQAGQVIGVNTMKISTAEGLGFSIPINVAKPIIEQIIETGEYHKVALGFSGTDIATYESAFQIDTGLDSGVVLLRVMAESPIAKAGLEKLDVLTKVDGQVINNVLDVQKILYQYKFGDSLEIEYVRDDQSYTARVLLEPYDLDQNN
ncbi:MAG: S1C family serine protease [Bacillota bacterium]|nr:S1C family serine protease [Bacillota bacterium]